MGEKSTGETVKKSGVNSVTVKQVEATVVGFDLKVIPERVGSEHSGTARDSTGGMGMGGFQCRGLYWSGFLGLQVTETTQFNLRSKGNPSGRVTEKPGGRRGRPRASKQRSEISMDGDEVGGVEMGVFDAEE